MLLRDITFLRFMDEWPFYIHVIKITVKSPTKHKESLSAFYRTMNLSAEDRNVRHFYCGKVSYCRLRGDSCAQYCVAPVATITARRRFSLELLFNLFFEISACLKKRTIVLRSHDRGSYVSKSVQ